MSRPFRKTFLYNLILIGLICVAIYWVFFMSLKWITGHGEEMRVPELEGKAVGQAIAELENLGFRIDVDSVYDPAKGKQEVIDQQPKSGAKVKKGRTIFLTVNKEDAPNIEMPNLVNLSFRSAEMLLKSNKLILGDTQLVPDLADGAVLNQLYQGKEIAAGTPLPQGSRINLVIGDGLGTKEFPIPDIVGLSYLEAVAILNGSNLNFTVIFDGVITDTLSAVVYSQVPEALNEFHEHNTISEGDVIDFRVKQDMDY